MKDKQINLSFPIRIETPNYPSQTMDMTVRCVVQSSLQSLRNCFPFPDPHLHSAVTSLPLADNSTPMRQCVAVSDRHASGHSHRHHVAAALQRIRHASIGTKNALASSRIVYVHSDRHRERGAFSPALRWHYSWPDAVAYSRLHHWPARAWGLGGAAWQRCRCGLRCRPTEWCARG